MMLTICIFPLLFLFTYGAGELKASAQRESVKTIVCPNFLNDSAAQVSIAPGSCTVAGSANYYVYGGSFFIESSSKITLDSYSTGSNTNSSFALTRQSLYTTGRYCRTELYRSRLDLENSTVQSGMYVSIYLHDDTKITMISSKLNLNQSALLQGLSTTVTMTNSAISADQLILMQLNGAKLVLDTSEIKIGPLASVNLENCSVGFTASKISLAKGAQLIAQPSSTVVSQKLKVFASDYSTFNITSGSNLLATFAPSSITIGRKSELRINGKCMFIGSINVPDNTVKNHQW